MALSLGLSVLETEYRSPGRVYDLAELHIRRMGGYKEREV